MKAGSLEWRARRERFPFHELVTHSYNSPSRVAVATSTRFNEALAAMVSWSTGKTVIRPNG